MFEGLTEMILGNKPKIPTTSSTVSTGAHPPAVASGASVPKPDMFGNYLIDRASPPIQAESPGQVPTPGMFDAGGVIHRTLSAQTPGTTPEVLPPNQEYLGAVERLFADPWSMDARTIQDFALVASPLAVAIPAFGGSGKLGLGIQAASDLARGTFSSSGRVLRQSPLITLRPYLEILAVSTGRSLSESIEEMTNA
mgnify:CR=1 FL=1